MSTNKNMIPDWPAKLQTAHEANVHHYNEENGTKIRIGAGDCMFEELPRVIMLHNLQVFTTERRKGIGSQLIEEVKKFAREVHKPILLTFSPEEGHEDDLRRFYKRHHFSFLSDGTTMRWKP